MEMKNCAHISALQFFLIIGRTEECQCHTIRSQRRLNDIGNVFFLLLIIKIRQILAGCLLMSGEIVVCTVSNSPQFSPPKWE